MFPLQWLILVAACIGTLCSAGAAEVAGTVGVQYQGLFKVDTSVQGQPISVALFPGEGQRPGSRGPRVQQIDIVGHRMRPAFVSIQKGDRVTFVNHDPDFHRLFSLSHSAPISAQLAKAGSQRNPSVTLQPEPGTTHVFCRIHNKSYARIEVLETPHLKTVRPGESFRFGDLEPGRWKLRLASPGAETQWAEVMALTAPPTRRFTLISHGGGTAAGTHEAQAGVEQLYRE